MLRWLCISTLICLAVYVVSSAEDNFCDEWADSPTIHLDCGDFPTVKVLVDSQETECRGLIRDGRSYLPAREVLERLGGRVLWVQDEQAFYARFEEHDRTIKVTVGSRDVVIYSYDASVRTGAGERLSSRTLNADPFICEGRVFAPIRSSTEAVGGSVHYDRGSKIIYVTSPAGVGLDSGAG